MLKHINQPYNYGMTKEWRVRNSGQFGGNERIVETPGAYNLNYRDACPGVMLEFFTSCVIKLDSRFNVLNTEYYLEQLPKSQVNSQW